MPVAPTAICTGNSVAPTRRVPAPHSTSAPMMSGTLLAAWRRASAFFVASASPLPTMNPPTRCWRTSVSALRSSRPLSAFPPGIHGITICAAFSRSVRDARVRSTHSCAVGAGVGAGRTSTGSAEEARAMAISVAVMRCCA